jgi:hypothetical protein
MKTLEMPPKKKIETLLCAAVDTSSHQRRLESCSLCAISGIVLKNDKAVPNL